MNNKKKNIPLVNREISWLDFNERVLQEAIDLSVPVLERLRFLGIFSNNLDEFFRVRVATIKRLAELPKSEQKLFSQDPTTLLQEINSRALALQSRFEKTYTNILKELKKKNINIVDDQQLLPEHYEFVEEYFEDAVRSRLFPVMLEKNKLPRLNGNSIYFAVKLIGAKNKADYALVEIPSLVISRFLVLPSIGKQKYVILLDDVIRFKLQEVFAIFDYKKIEAYTIKVTLDAELDIDDDISKSNIDKISKSLKKRKTAQPVRFIYDKAIPQDLLNFIINQVKPVRTDSIIPAGKYHNFKDFIGFPKVGGKDLNYKLLPPLEHPDLKDKVSILNEISKKDILLNYPYQSFNYIINLLREAALNPRVTSVKINLYRVAKDSKIIHALINASKNGKKVTVVIEPRARFDEKINIYFAGKLQDQEVNVIFGIPRLKVHAKLILISRKEGNKTVKYAHVGTGNFHEKNALVYTDTSLLTANTQITNEVNKVFRLFKNIYERPTFKHLMVSPFNTRRKINALIDQEIVNAKGGKNAFIIMKLNNLVDPLIIKKLYKASTAGVKIQLIIRGICSLVPGVKGVSENISVIGIVDRFLEHNRIMVFCNNDDELYYLISADMMSRNLNLRIEVGTPIYDDDLKKVFQDILDMHLKDNTKARLVNLKGENNTYKKRSNKKKLRSQIALYDYFKKSLTTP